MNNSLYEFELSASEGRCTVRISNHPGSRNTATCVYEREIHTYVFDNLIYYYNEDCDNYDGDLVEKGMDFFDALDCEYIKVSSIQRRFRGIQIYKDKINFWPFEGRIVSQSIHTIFA